MSSTGYIRHFERCHAHDLSHFVPFCIGHITFGYIKNEFADFLISETGFFESKSYGLELARRFGDFASRSEALAKAAQALSQKTGTPLRNEMYPVALSYAEEPSAQIDRAAVPWFGVRAWGLHVNGYVKKKDGLYLWIGRRADDRQVEPGKLDNMIGGGNPIGIGLDENLCKEAKEEANIDAPLALTSTLAREINYKVELSDGLRVDTLFIYDLKLPESFVPSNTDGEVEAFTLMPLAQVSELVKNTDEFKFNCGMVVIDFLMRHGFIGPQDPEYDRLNKWLK